MDHDAVKDQFTLLYEGELDDETKEMVEEHLRECESCHGEWEAYRQALSEVSGLMALAPPADVASAVERKIHRRSRGRFFKKSGVGSVQSAIVSFVLILLFMLAYLMLTAVNELVVLEGESPAQTEPSGANADGP